MRLEVTPDEDIRHVFHEYLIITQGPGGGHAPHSPHYEGAFFRSTFGF